MHDDCKQCTAERQAIYQNIYTDVYDSSLRYIPSRAATAGVQYCTVVAKPLISLYCRTHIKYPAGQGGVGIFGNVCNRGTVRVQYGRAMRYIVEGE